MKSVSRVFLGGPVQYAVSPDGKFEGHLKQVILKLVGVLLSAGYQVDSCHLEEDFGRDIPADTADLAARDYHWMKKCDAYVALFSSDADGHLRRSDGTCIEIGWATALKKPVLLVLDGISETSCSHLLQGLAAAGNICLTDMEEVFGDPDAFLGRLAQLIYSQGPEILVDKQSPPEGSFPVEKHALTHLKIFADYQCNLNCVHCVHANERHSVNNRPGPDLDGQMHDFLTEAYVLNPDLHIYLSGGEPLMSSRFFKLAGILRDLGYRYKTITNGLLLEERSNDLLAAPPEKLWITFNGTGRRHDRTVGKSGSFEKLVQSVRKSLPGLRQAGIYIGAVLMINPMTFHRLTDDVDVIAKFGFDEIVVQHLSFLPGALVHAHNLAYRNHFGCDSRFCFGQGADGSGIEYKALAQQLDALKKRDDPFPLIVFPPFDEPEQLADYYGKHPMRFLHRKCGRALHELWVRPDGEVTVCFGHRVGHVKQGPASILASEDLRFWQKRFSSLKTPLPGCTRCHRLYMGSCRSSPGKVITDKENHRKPA